MFEKSRFFYLLINIFKNVNTIIATRITKYEISELSLFFRVLEWDYKNNHLTRNCPLLLYITIFFHILQMKFFFSGQILQLQQCKIQHQNIYKI